MPSKWRSDEAACQIPDHLERPSCCRRDQTGLQGLAEIAAGDARHQGRCCGTANRPKTSWGADRRGRNRQEVAQDGRAAQHPAQRLERLLPEAAHEAVAGGVGEVERAVADIGIAVPALRGERVLRHRIGGAEATEQGIVDAAVHVHQANVVQLFVAGEAARGLAGQAACRVVGAIGVPPFAPGVPRVWPRQPEDRLQ